MLPNKRFEKQNTEVGIGFAGYGGTAAVETEGCGKSRGVHGFWNMAGVVGEFRSPGKTEISPDKGWKQEFKRVGKEPFGNSAPRFPCPAGED